MTSQFGPHGAGFMAWFMFDWAAFHARRQLRLQGRCLDALLNPSDSRWAGVQRAFCDGLSHALAWPFDLLRVQHASAVQAGAWPRSLLESKRFESDLGALERLSLGPLARSV